MSIAYIFIKLWTGKFFGSLARSSDILTLMGIWKRKGKGVQQYTVSNDIYTVHIQYQQ